MKLNHFKKIGLLFVLAIFMYSCECKKCNTENRVNHDEVKKSLISSTSAVEMHHRYLKRTQLIQDTLSKKYGKPFHDTQFVWTSYENMKNYMAYLAEIEKEYPDKKISGIRIYFGVYPNNKSNYANQTSMFMIPTTPKKGDKSKYAALNHYPFVIESEGNGLNGNYKVVEELVYFDGKANYGKQNSKQQANALFSSNMNLTLDEISTIQNEYTAVPPPLKTGGGKE